MGLIIPKRLLDSMSWWQADILHVEGNEGKIIISNLTTKQVQPFHMKNEYGDAFRGKT
jgi:hypothetical protein